jgi:8-oxo-dGTP diphosphatase
VLLTVDEGELKVLLLHRQTEPARNKWALPGGFVGIDEPLELAARRVLERKVHLPQLYVEQLFTFGDPARDPRTRVISVAHFALVPADVLRASLNTAPPEPLTLARVRVPWEGERGGPAAATDDAGHDLSLAFDHADILGMAVKRLRGRLRYSPVAFELMPREFTLRMLQSAYEAISGAPHNKDAFRRRILASGEVKATGRLETDVGHRPAELYRYRPASP